MTDEEYLRYYLSQRAPVKRRTSCLEVIFVSLMAIMLLYALAVKGPELLVTYGLVSVDTMTRLLNVDAAPTPGQAPPATPALIRTTGGSTSASQPSRPLPVCSAVQDTRTACEQDAAPPTPAPIVPTAAPPYVTNVCETAPNARPCWLPADQAWQEPASVPETPIVLVAPARSCVPLPASDPCWGGQQQQARSCVPLPPNDPCWKKEQP